MSKREVKVRLNVGFYSYLFCCYTCGDATLYEIFIEEWEAEVYSSRPTGTEKLMPWSEDSASHIHICIYTYIYIYIYVCVCVCVEWSMIKTKAEKIRRLRNNLFITKMQTLKVKTN